MAAAEDLRSWARGHLGELRNRSGIVQGQQPTRAKILSIFTLCTLYPVLCAVFFCNRSNFYLFPRRRCFIL
ncbi:hypothetical protein BDZ91DRAFT_718505, partial [Kalaharituber pfeilii]